MEPGEWRIDRFIIQDKAGNRLYLMIIMEIILLLQVFYNHMKKTILEKRKLIQLN